MPTVFWIVLWLAVLAVLAVFAVRERRSGRRGLAEVDRNGHAAVREAGANQDGRGPNGASQTWVG